MFTGKYEFINRQGKNCTLIIEENELDNKGLGYLKVKEFYIENILIHSLEETKCDCVVLCERYDKSIDKRIFAIRITRSALKNYLDYGNINYKETEAYICIDNIELEKIYKELPNIRAKEKEDKQEKILKQSLNITFKLKESLNNFYLSCSNELSESATFKKFINLLNNIDVQSKYKYMENYRKRSDDFVNYSNIYYELNVTEIIKLINIFEDIKEKNELEKLRIEKEKEEKREAEINKLKVIAKETGKKQLYDSMTLPCSSKNEECNMDILYKYILPNGEFEEERVHTY